MADCVLKERADCLLCHCEVRQTDNLGRAAFATRDLPAGAPVLVESPFLRICDGFAWSSGAATAVLKSLENIAKKHDLAPSMMPFFEPCFAVDWQQTTAADRALLLENFYHPHSASDLQPYADHCTAPPTGVAANEKSIYSCLAACAELAQLPYLATHVPEWGGIEWYQFLQAADLNIHKDATTSASVGPQSRGQHNFAGLFLVGSKFTHSCAPNCLWQFDAKGCLVYICLRKILNGEMLTFSYVGDGIDLLQGTLQRRRGLAKLQFVCNCVRCAAPDIARSIPCSACGKENGLLPCYDDVVTSSSTATNSCAGASCTPGKCIMPLVTQEQFRDASTWECQFCGFVSDPPQHIQEVERELYQRVTASFASGNSSNSMSTPASVSPTTPTELDELHFDIQRKLGPYHWLSLAAAFLRLARLAKSMDGAGMLTMGAGEARKWAFIVIDGIRRSIPGSGPLMRALFISVRIGSELGWPECAEWAKEGKSMSRYHKDNVGAIGIARKVFESVLSGQSITVMQH